METPVRDRPPNAKHSAEIRLKCGKTPPEGAKRRTFPGGQDLRLEEVGRAAEAYEQ